MATNMPPVHAVDGIYRPIYRRSGGPPADCPWGLIARANLPCYGPGYQGFGTDTPLYPNYNRPGNPGKRKTAGGGGQDGQSTGDYRNNWIGSMGQRRQQGVPMEVLYLRVLFYVDCPC